MNQLERAFALVFILFVLLIIFAGFNDFFPGLVFLQGAGCSGMVSGTTFTDSFDNSDCITSPTNVTVSGGSVSLASSSGGGEITPDAGTLLLMHLNDNVSGAGQTIADNSGQNNNGTINGNVNCTVAGKYGGGCYFDGDKDYISLSNSGVGTGTSNLTVSAWVKSDLTTTATSRGIVTKWGTTGNAYNLFLFNNWNRARFGVRNDIGTGGNGDANSGTTFFDNAWHHVVGVYDGSSVKLYWDGRLQNAQQPLTGPVATNSQPLWIGTIDPNSSTASWSGIIDEVAIWNRALSASEISTLFGNPITSGAFSSGVIHMGAAYNAITPSWAGTGLSNVQVQISGDNSTWCTVTNNQQVAGSNCALPSTQIYYKVAFTGPASLDFVQLSFSNIQLPVCGNGVVEAGEQCDGSVPSGQTCQTYGFNSGALSCTASCTIDQSNCRNVSTVCGNGTLETGESCDDGNPTNNDGCSSICGIEYNYNCIGSPSNCSPINWTPPIGIPEPSFGIREQAGPVTHIVGTQNCTDINNPNGTPERPRCKPPTTLPAGSVVEVQSGTYFWTTTSNPAFRLISNGTSSNPVFVRGVGNPRPIIKNHYSDPVAGRASLLIGGQYLVFENFELDGVNAPFDVNVHHMAFRNLDIHDNMYGTGSATSCSYSNNIIFYNNLIHNNGDWEATTGDPDYLGTKVGSYCQQVWILDNVYHHNASDGAQIGGSASSTQGHLGVEYVYVGRNTSYQNRQTGFGAKSGRHIIFSQNEVFGHRASSSADGAGIATCCNEGDGDRSGGDHYWFLFNYSHHNNQGLYNRWGSDVFFIGNLIHDINKEAIVASNVNPRTSPLVYVYNNTIYNTAIGIVNSKSEGFHYANNIISSLHDSTRNCNGIYHLCIGQAPAGSQMDNSLLYQPSGVVKLRWVGRDYNLSNFPTQNGTSNLEADPLFANPSSNDFELQINSPVINAGTSEVEAVYDYFESTYGINIKKDFYGRARPVGNWDMGALEFGASGGCVVTCDSNQTCSQVNSNWYCQNPGQCNSYCANIPQQCTPACDSNSDCPGQFCQNPGACGAACVNTPVPQNCADSDGDGVSETPNCSAYLDQCPNTATSVLVNRRGCPMPIGYNLFTPSLTSDFNASDLNRLEGLSLGIANKAKIVFGQPVRLLNFNSSQNRHEPVNLMQTVDLNNNKVDVRSSLFAEFNKPARVTLFGLGFTNPVVKKDGVTCLNCLIESYSSGSLVFTVPGFSVYTSAEGTCGDSWCQLNETCSSCQTDCGVCPPTPPGDDGSGPGDGSSDTGNPGHPLPNTRCTRIPVQPCPLAQWQEYPLCSWDVRQCTGEFSEQCVAGQKRCSEAYLQECSQENEWVNSQECVNGCNVEALECNPLPLTCTENWVCTQWSECLEGWQSRTCTDQNNCSTLQNQPPTTQECTTQAEQNPLFVMGVLAAAIIITIIASILFIKQVIKKT